jgi:hypothetical protein
LASTSMLICTHMSFFASFSFISVKTRDSLFPSSVSCDEQGCQKVSGEQRGKRNT